MFSVDVAGAYNQLTVYHGYVASSYHSGIISGFTLISSYMENVASNGKTASIYFYLGKLQNLPLVWSSRKGCSKGSL